MAITVPQTLQNLLGYFQAGDKPNADQFEELIRTCFYQYQESLDTAQATLDMVTAALAAAEKRTAKALCFASFNSGTNAYTLVHGYNILSVGHGATGMRVNFTNAFADANYLVLPSIQGGDYSGGVSGSRVGLVKVGALTAGYCEVAFPNLATGGSQVSSLNTAPSSNAKLMVACFDPR